MGFVDKAASFFTAGLSDLTNASPSEKAGLVVGAATESLNRERRAEIRQAQLDEFKREKAAKLDEFKREKAAEDARLYFEQAKETERSRLERASKEEIERLRRINAEKVATIKRGGIIQAKQMQIQADITRHLDEQALKAQQDLTKEIYNGTVSGEVDNHIIDGNPASVWARQIVPYSKYILDKKSKKQIPNPRYIRAMESLKLILNKAEKNKLKFNEYENFVPAYQRYQLAIADDGFKGTFKDWVEKYETGRPTKPATSIQEYDKYVANEKANKTDPSKIMSYKSWVEKVEIKNTGQPSKSIQEYDKYVAQAKARGVSSDDIMTFESWMEKFELKAKGRPSTLIQEYEKYLEDAKNRKTDPSKIMSFQTFWIKRYSDNLSPKQMTANQNLLNLYHKGENRNIWSVKDGDYLRGDDGKKVVDPRLRQLLMVMYPKIKESEIYSHALNFQQIVNEKISQSNEKGKQLSFSNIPIIGSLFKDSPNFRDRLLYMGDQKSGSVDKLGVDQASELLMAINQNVHSIIGPQKTTAEALIHFFTSAENTGKIKNFTIGQRRMFGNYYVKLAERLLQPRDMVLSGGVKRQVFTNLVQAMPNVHKVMQVISPATAQSYSNYNSSVKALAEVEVATPGGSKYTYVTKITNTDASDHLLKVIGNMKGFVEKNPHIEDYVNRLLKKESLSGEDYEEIQTLLASNNTSYQGFENLKEVFDLNPFMFIPYIEAVGFGNKKVTGDSMNIFVDSVRVLAKPSNHKDHNSFWKEQAKRRQQYKDVLNITEDMLTMAQHLTKGQEIQAGDSLYQAVNKIGRLSAIGTGSTIAKTIMSAFETVEVGLNTFASEFKSFSYNIDKLVGEVSTLRPGIDPKEFQARINSELSIAQETYKSELSIAKKSVNRSEKEKAARHRLGLRSILLFKKIALTYKLAGLVQGDQSGGRTISNQDFDQVYSALWSTSEVGNIANLEDLKSDIILRTRSGDAYDLLYELKGTNLNPSIHNSMDKIFRAERKNFYRATNREDPREAMIEGLSTQSLSRQTAFILLGQGTKDFNEGNMQRDQSVKHIRRNMIDTNTATSANIEDFIKSISFLNRDNREMNGVNPSNSALRNVIENAAKIYGIRKDDTDNPLKINGMTPIEAYSSNEDIYKKLSKNGMLELVKLIDFSNFNTATSTSSDIPFITKYLNKLINETYFLGN